jgi:hypothetical protein
MAHVACQTLPETAIAAGRRRSGRDAASSRASYAGWCVLGFLAGAVFWHAVGFWDFLGDMTSMRPAQKVVIGRLAPDRDPEASYEKQAHAAGAAMPQNCTTLLRDAATGLTLAQPCVAVIGDAAASLDAGALSGGPLPTAGRLDRLADKR